MLALAARWRRVPSASSTSPTGSNALPMTRERAAREAESVVWNCVLPVTERFGRLDFRLTVLAGADLEDMDCRCRTKLTTCHKRQDDLRSAGSPGRSTTEEPSHAPLRVPPLAPSRPARHRLFASVHTNLLRQFPQLAFLLDRRCLVVCAWPRLQCWELGLALQSGHHTTTDACRWQVVSSWSRKLCALE